jgi:hypothetical protein
VDWWLGGGHLRLMGTRETSHRAEPCRLFHPTSAHASRSRQYAERRVKGVPCGQGMGTHSRSGAISNLTLARAPHAPDYPSQGHETPPRRATPWRGSRVLGVPQSMLICRSRPASRGWHPRHSRRHPSAKRHPLLRPSFVRARRSRALLRAALHQPS